MLITVREGRPGTAMVGWKTQLSDTQIAAIVDYVRTKFMDVDLKPATAGASAVTPGQQLPTPSNLRTNPVPVTIPLSGNLGDGRRLYDQNCTACHGKLGDGNGPRAYFISPKPRSFISTESRAAFSRPVLIHSIAQGKLGTEMPSWEKVLSAQEIANVAEYVYQRFITPDSKIGTRDSK
jgi:mono/diheme cytochrome c family protein